MTEHIPKDKTDKGGQLLVESDQNAHVLKREGLLTYFRNSWREFKKVVWPSRDDAIKMTIFVVIFVMVLAAFIYVVDSTISWLFFDILLKKE